MHLKFFWYFCENIVLCNPQPATRNPQPATRNPQPATRKLFKLIIFIAIYLIITLPSLKAQVNCNLQPISPDGNECNPILSPRVNCLIQNNNQPRQLEVMVEPDLEFCQQFASHGEMLQYIDELFQEISNTFKYYLDLEVVRVQDVPWYDESNNPYLYNGNSAYELLGFYRVMHAWANSCVPRDANIMFSGKQLSPAGVATSGKNYRPINFCDDDFHSSRQDYALATVSSQLLNRDKQVVAHELLHLLPIGHSDGILNSPINVGKFPGCVPDSHCKNNCFLMCTSICAEEGNQVPSSGMAMECFMQNRAYNLIVSSAANCLLEDSPAVVCKRCQILTRMTASRPKIYLGTCNNEGNEVTITFTVCNDGCEGKNLQIALAVGNPCDGKFTKLSENFDQGFSESIYGNIYNVAGDVIKGFEYQPKYHQLDECHDFEFTFRINEECEIQADFSPKIFINGSNYNLITGRIYDNAKLNIRYLNNYTIGADNTTTLFSSLRQNNVASFGIINGTCTNGEPPYKNNLKILGTLVMDEDFKFSESIFEMAENAKIVINPDIQVCFENIEFYSCSGLWQGIHTQTNGALSMKQCNVQDAVSAATFESQSYYNLFDNVFNNNITGVWMKGTGTITGYPYPYGSVAFENNLFTSNRALKASYSLNGVQATKSLEGLKLTLVQDPFIVSGTNSFEDMVYGIYAKKSNLIIDQAQFKNIISEFSQAPPPFNYKYPPLETGGAICLTESSSLKYEGRGHSGVDIENCQIGIIAHGGSNIDMQNVYVFDAQKGVFLVQNQGGNYFIKQCYFSSRESGIELHLSNPYKLKIHNNEFHALSDVNAAIRTNDFLLTSFDNSREILNNKIFLDGLSSGFNFNGTKGYLIAGNHITFSKRDDALQTGTYLSNSETNNLKCNTYSTLFPGTGQSEVDVEVVAGTGIAIHHSPYNTFECNTHHTLKSWQINGSCDNSKITGNYNYWHDIGLYMTNQTMIGQQLKHVNSWVFYNEDNPSQHIEAIYDTDNGFLIDGSRFETRSGHPWTPQWKTQISDYQNPQAAPWFILASPPYKECNLTTCEQYTSNFEGEWTSLDSLISRRERNALPDFRDGTWFNTQWHLYDRIQKGYYNVLTQEALDFIDSLSSGNLGNLYTASELIRGLYDFNAAHEEYKRNLSEALQQVSILNYQIRAIPDSLTSQNTDLTTQRDAALQNANQIYTQVNNYTGLTAAQVQQIAQQAIDLLPITTNEVVSNLAYTLKTIAILRAQNALPGTAVRDSLMMISTQCPDDGGIGVHLARALLSAWGLYIGEDPACTQIAEPRDSPPTIDEMNVNFLKLVPNPANTMVRLSLLDDIQMKEIKVFNSHGVLVIYKNIASTSQYDLDIRTLPAGIYIVQAMDAAHKSYHARLSCIR